MSVEQFLGSDTHIYIYSHTFWGSSGVDMNKQPFQRASLQPWMNEFVFSPAVHPSVSAGTQIDAVCTQTYWLHVGFMVLPAPSL